MKKIDNPKEEGEHDVFDAASAADKKAAVTEAVAKKVAAAKQPEGKAGKAALVAIYSGCAIWGLGWHTAGKAGKADFVAGGNP